MAQATTEPKRTSLMEDVPNVTSLMDSDPYYTADGGACYHGDSRDLLDELPEESIDLIVTSPPFALKRKKDYGNKNTEDYNDWFMDFAHKVKRVLKPDGSFVVDIGGGWQQGEPYRSTYHFELLTRLAGSDGPFELAQDAYWYNPAKLPTPAQWVTIERIRITDAVNHVWWLAKGDERPEADNTRVLQEYSDSQKKLMEEGYRDKKRPSGHDISDKFDEPENGEGSIPDNLIEAANTASNTHYLKACRELDVEPHPARFPRDLPEFFVKFLTENPPYEDEDDKPLVLDIFAGSNLTGRVAADHGRNWMAFERQEQYVQTSKFRFMEMEAIKQMVDDDQTDFGDFADVEPNDD